MRGYPPSGLAPDGDYRVITLGHDALAQSKPSANSARSWWGTIGAPPEWE
jgi:hypothetical protein